MNKKAKVNIFVILLLIYLGLGVFYHINQKNSNDMWTTDLFTGGFKIIQSWISKVPSTTQQDYSILWLSFENNLKDISQNSNNATFYGEVNYTSGKYNNAVSLNGTGYINVPNQDYLKLDSSNYLSVGMWVYLDSSDTDGGYILGKPFNWCGDYNYYIQAYNLTDNRVFIAGATGFSSPMTIPRDSWHYIGFTVNSTHLNAYVDGVLTSSEAHGITDWNPPYCANPADSLAIGTLFPYKIAGVPSSYSIKGKIDELKIWSGTLSVGEFI